MKRKNILFCLFVSLVFVSLLPSCSSYYLYDVGYKNQNDTTKTLVFENDTISLSYNFWGENGITAFLVYNKLSVPIYIDWRKSSFIVNSQKFDYWQDNTTITSVSQNKNYFYTGNYKDNLSYNLFNVSKGVSISEVKKEERITFIPPQSYILKAAYLILVDPISGIKLDSTKCEIVNFCPNIQSNKCYNIKYINFSKSSSPIVFRNFLTYSTTETFIKESFIDNEFWIERISDMPSYVCEGYCEGKKTYPFKTPSRFYISH